jgi:hypothetical protein
VGSDSRGIWLESVCNGSDDEAAVEAVVEEPLPALFLVFLARPQTPQPAARRVVVVAVVAARGPRVGVCRVFGAQGAGGGEEPGFGAQRAPWEAFGQHLERVVCRIVGALEWAGGGVEMMYLCTWGWEVAVRGPVVRSPSLF